jgi:hypothetical protein
VPFDEGALTGALTPESSWPIGDWRNSYFDPDNLAATLPRVERLRPLVPEGMDLPALALRFVLEQPAVSTTIPGMRRPRHVERNMAVSSGARLPPRLLDALRVHRWERGGVLPAAVEQLRSQRFFEPTDLLAQRRLSGAQARRCSRKAELFGDRDEIAQMPEFHCLFIRAL